MVGLLEHTIYSDVVSCLEANIKCSVNEVIGCCNNHTLEYALRLHVRRKAFHMSRRSYFFIVEAAIIIITTSLIGSLLLLQGKNTRTCCLPRIKYACNHTVSLFTSFL